MQYYFVYILTCLIFLNVSQNTWAQKLNTDGKKVENIRKIYSDVEKYNLSQKFSEIKQLIDNGYNTSTLDSIFRIQTSLAPDYEWTKVYSAWILTFSSLTVQDIRNLLLNKINIIEQTIFYPTLEGAILLASATVEAEVTKSTTQDHKIPDGYATSTILKIKRLLRGNIDVGIDSTIVLRQPSSSIDSDNIILMQEKERYVLFLSKEWHTVQEHLYKNPELREASRNLPSNIYQCIVPMSKLNNISSSEFVSLKISPNNSSQKSTLIETEKLTAYFNSILEKTFKDKK